jgi:hypothetical protein
MKIFKWIKMRYRWHYGNYWDNLTKRCVQLIGVASSKRLHGYVTVTSMQKNKQQQPIAFKTDQNISWVQFLGFMATVLIIHPTKIVKINFAQK